MGQLLRFVKWSLVFKMIELFYQNSSEKSEVDLGWTNNFNKGYIWVRGNRTAAVIVLFYS